VTRREFPAAVRRAADKRAGGRCEICYRKHYGEFRRDHIIPDGIGGKPTLENCQIICLPCDRRKTPGDQTRVAKTKRMAKKHDGTQRRTSRPIMGGRRSKFKRKINGEVVLR
jgi:5-methylcytosine-specific restriction endonuclease McrA